MISRKSVAFDYPTPSRMPLPKLTFSKIAPSMGETDGLIVTDMDDTLGISKKGDYGNFINLKVRRGEKACRV